MEFCEHCVRGHKDDCKGDCKGTENSRLFAYICLGLVLKDDGLRLTFYRYMSNSPPVIFTNGIIDKSKPYLERSVNMLLRNKRFSSHTLTKIEP